jgi:hypothetical protein
VKTRRGSHATFKIVLDYRPLRGEIISVANEMVLVDGTPTLFSEFMNECGLLAAEAVRVLEVVHYTTEQGSAYPSVVVVAELCLNPVNDPGSVGPWQGSTKGET